jgi:hypothetical protein
MWPVYFVISYFLLALLIPVSWALGSAWRHARGRRQLTCPRQAGSANVALDPWFAVRGRTLGTGELRVMRCSRWPDHRDCTQECLAQIVER